MNTLFYGYTKLLDRNDAEKIGNEQNGQENRLFSESLLFLGALLGALIMLFFYKTYIHQRFAP